MRELEGELIAGLARELPGPAGQLRMAPSPRTGWSPGEWPDDSRHGGGLLLVYPRDRLPHVVLTLRNPDLALHAGQVSLPGGAVEAGEDEAGAALREAHEEVGLDSACVRLLGKLSPLHVPVSRFVIHPWVGMADGRPAFEADSREVARLLEVGLHELRDPSRQVVERWERSGAEVEIPMFEVHGEKVWGATAMILSEFLCLLGTPPAPGRS
jgi:8-oxo-dGTP pyrophosphatase MutT (NUDIX family)